MWTPLCTEALECPSIHCGRAPFQDWTWTGLILDARLSPAHHHTLHVGELAHSAQPGSHEQGARISKGSVCSTPRLMGLYLRTYTGILDRSVSMQCFGFVSIVKNLTQGTDVHGACRKYIYLGSSTGSPLLDWCPCAHVHWCWIRLFALYLAWLIVIFLTVLNCIAFVSTFYSLLIYSIITVTSSLATTP